MGQVTITLKLKFSALNQAKAKMFGEMTESNTRLANWLLTIPLTERRKLTTAKVETSLMSALANQTIRHTTSGVGKKVKQYKSLPPEINKQNWSIHKVGETYSLSFPTIKGTKRVPVEVASKHWQPILDRLCKGDTLIDKGSAKIIFHRNKWYAYISITLEVPEVPATTRIGCDRGQNNLAVVATAKGFGKFFNGKEVKHRRRHFQKRRHSLQSAKKFRALKKWDRRERRWMDAVNHTISRRIVRLAEYLNADVVIEDLEGCRDTMKQRKKNRADSGESRHSWAYYSLEQKLDYKLALKGLKLIKRPAPYTSKSCSTCGTIGDRKKHDFNCPNGHYHNADLNASRNLAGWDGFSCSLDLKRDAAVMVSSGLENGLLGTTPNLMKDILPSGEYL
ncbi:RNA-guided endonuclease InsQ/TnpB family protein [Microseira wollei]|uniref:Transposase, IS605 OrfB family protein n=1 Tax=Microseira wollei NIES-4236 TaxID=2530354 RepID=A0AAV3X816_9CYAN|nr:transposase [Microseira wollei]GET37498.1 transposase, IS605 OrfB family protein [Microseira wollei NIES-4236]